MNTINFGMKTGITPIRNRPGYFRLEDPSINSVDGVPVKNFDVWVTVKDAIYGNYLGDATLNLGNGKSIDAFVTHDRTDNSRSFPFNVFTGKELEEFKKQAES